LGRLAVPVFRTDRDGDVAVVAHQRALTAVQRGRRSSTISVGQRGQSRPGRVTISGCPILVPATVNRTGYRQLSWLWATRSSSSPVPSARSPPRSGSRSPALT
jgi:hypothetical protein